MEVIKSFEGITFDEPNCQISEIARLEERVVQVTCIKLEPRKPWEHFAFHGAVVLGVVMGTGMVSSDEGSFEITPQSWIILSPGERVSVTPKEDMHLIRIGSPIHSFEERTPYVDF